MPTPKKPGKRRGMLFGIAVGSEGGAPERYSVHLPFEFSNAVTRVAEREPLTFSLGHLTARLESRLHGFALNVGPFSSELEATSSFPALRLALLWMALRERVGLESPRVITPVRLDEPPLEISPRSDVFPVFAKAHWTAIDGHYEADEAVVVPEHKRMSRFEAGRMKMSKDVPFSLMATHLAEASPLFMGKGQTGLSRITVAMETYSGALLLPTTIAAFLGLVTVLEVLATRSDQNEAMVRLTERMVELVDQELVSANEALVKVARSGSGCEDPATAGIRQAIRQLKGMKSRVNDLKITSIRESIRELAFAAAQAIPELGDVDDVRRRSDRCYGLRSQLLHSGRLDPGVVHEASLWLLKIVPVMLEALIRGKFKLPEGVE